LKKEYDEKKVGVAQNFEGKERGLCSTIIAQI
jgi:hypothetical protein